MDETRNSGRAQEDKVATVSWVLERRANGGLDYLQFGTAELFPSSRDVTSKQTPKTIETPDDRKEMEGRKIPPV